MNKLGHGLLVVIVIIALAFVYFKQPWRCYNMVEGNDSQTSTTDSALTSHLSRDVLKESCQTCHREMSGFAPAHDPKKIGCVACHLGNPKSENKVSSHRGMITIPGNLSDAALTCSTSKCHAGIDIRVKLSLMNTMRGVVGVDKFVFGETQSFDGLHDIKTLGHTAADTHLRNLCASCHLGQQKEETGPVSELSRGGGCNACHLNYSQQAKVAHEQYHRYQKKILPKIHPTLNLNISPDHCFGCHSRSGRLSTNYEGWHETQLSEKDVIGKPGYRILEDERVFTYVKEDVHHARGMICIDCHGSFDVMGYGVFTHQEQAVSTTCEDCHTNKKPQTVTYQELADDDQRIVRLRGFPTGNRFVVGRKSHRPIYNVMVDEVDRLIMIGKTSHKKYTLTPPGKSCLRDGVHAAITCSGCHTSWAPQCISCHTTYKSNSEHYDLLDHQMKKGAWEETGSHYFAEFPALGVVEDKGERRIKTFIPGMVMTLDRSQWSKKTKGKGKKVNMPDERQGGVLRHANQFYRLYAPTSPHTITAKGRGCKECHNNPVVLGYGRGKLQYQTKGEDAGKWQFLAQFSPSPADGLPQDAWIGFLQDNKTQLSKVNDTNVKSSDGMTSHKVQTTRTHARPFLRSEQEKILRVGACLTCHREDSQVVRDMLVDWVTTRKKCKRHKSPPLFKPQ